MTKLVKYEQGKAVNGTIVLPDNKNYFTIGRELDNFVVIPKATISGHHAMIIRFENGLYLIDHSKNGTYYNEKEPEFEREQKLESVVDSPRFKRYKERMFLKDRKVKTDFEYLMSIVSDRNLIGLLCDSNSGAKSLNNQGFMGFGRLEFELYVYQILIS